jgi:hypothetical protein
MANSTQKLRAAEGPRIGLSQQEIRYWTLTLCCTEDELRRAVESVGLSVFDVKKYFYA